MACVHIKKESGRTAKLASKNLFRFTFCLSLMFFLAFSWSNTSEAQTSQGKTQVNSLNLKWLAASPSLVGFDKSRLEASAESIGRMKGVYSVIVVRNNYLVLEHYFREGSRLKPHNLKSATKSVMAALTGIAIDKDYLRLDQPISDFLPQFAYLEDPRKFDITILHLLNMTSGLEQSSYQAYNSLATNSTDWVWTILNRPLVADPGTKHQYSTGDTHILSAVLTKATGMSTRDFAEKYLFGPLGISVIGWEIDPKGIYQGGNNLSLIPLDMALFGQLYLDWGIYRNRQIIPKWWVEASTRPNYLSEHPVYGYYGYLWYSRPGRNDAFVAVGYGGQYIYVSPEYNCVVVITSTLESKGKAWEKELFKYIQEGILGSIETEQQQLMQVAYEGKESPGLYKKELASGSDNSGGKRMGIAATSLNLRKGPGRKSAIIKLLDAGTVLEIQEEKDTWLKVKAVDLNGWVSAKYVRFINPERVRFTKHTPETVRPSKKETSKQAPVPLSSVGKPSGQGEALGSSQELVAQLQKNLEASRKTKKQLEEDLAGAREKLAAQQQDSVQLEADRKTLQKELAELQIQVDAQGTNISTLQNTRDKLQAELVVLQKELAIQQVVITSSDTVKKELESKLAATLQQIKELEEAQGRISKQESKTLKKLEQELAEERAQLKIVQQTLQEKLAAELAAARQQIVNLQKKLHDFQVKEDESAATIIRVNEELKILKQKNILLVEARDTMQAELVGVQKEITVHKELVSQAESARQELESELSAARALIAELNKKERDIGGKSSSTRQQLEQELATERTKLADVNNMLLESQASNKKLSINLAKQEKELKVSQQEKLQIEAKSRSLANELSGMQDQLDSQTDTLTTVQKKRDTLRAELSQLQQELEEQKQAAEDKADLENLLAESRKQFEELRKAHNDALTEKAKGKGQLEAELIAE